MYGWINNCLEDMVITNYGLDKWERIKEVAGCFVPTGDFILSVHYDDELTYSLIDAAAKVLGHTSAEVWEIYGRHFIHFLEANHYSGTLRGQGKTLRDWIQNINEPHRLLRARYPKCTLPEFWSENDAADVTGESILLHYYSPRTGGLASIVIGMCKEASKVYFDKELDMEFVHEEEFDWTTEQTAAGSNFRHHSVWRLRNVGKEHTYESLSSNDSLVSTPCPPRRQNAPREAAALSMAELDASLSVGDIAAAAGCPFHRKSTAAKPNAASTKPLQLQPPPTASQSPLPREPQGETLSPSADASPSQRPRPDLLLRVPHVAGYSIGPRAFKRLFPFHIIVNRRMEIVQIGNKLNDFVERAQLPSLLGTRIADVFSLCVTDRFPWSWAGLKKLANQATITLHSVLPAARALKLVGEVTLLDDDRRHRRRAAAAAASLDQEEDDEEKDDVAAYAGPGGEGGEEQEVVAALLVNPVVSDMLALLRLGFDLSDLPRHSFQRDVLQMEEHLKTELNNTVRMTQLSKHLEHESKKSTDALKMKRIFVRYVSHEIRTPLNVSLLGLKYIEDELLAHQEDATAASEAAAAGDAMDDATADDEDDDDDDAVAVSSLAASTRDLLHTAATAAMALVPPTAHDAMDVASQSTATQSSSCSSQTSPALPPAATLLHGGHFGASQSALTLTTTFTTTSTSCTASRTSSRRQLGLAQTPSQTQTTQPTSVDPATQRLPESASATTTTTATATTTTTVTKTKRSLDVAALQDVLADVKASCIMAVEILNDLLLYEKIDDGIFSLAQAPLSLRGFVSEAAKLFRMQAKGTGVRFVILGNVFAPPRRALSAAECRKRRRRHSTGSVVRGRLLRNADAEDDDDAVERDAYRDVYHDAEVTEHDAHEADEAFFADARYGDRVVVSADKAKLHQVLRNLFTNAIKFTPQHGLIALSCDVLTFPRVAAAATAAPRGVEEDKRPDGDGDGDVDGRVAAADEAQGRAGDAEETELRRLRAALAAVPEDAITFDGALQRPTPPPPPPSAISPRAALLSPSRSLCSATCASGSASPAVGGGQRSRANSAAVAVEGGGLSVDAASSAAAASAASLHRPPSLLLPATSSSAAACAASPSRFLRIAVTDSGCGISHEDQRQLFHEFIQVKADKLQNGQGSGLGLWIAANLMKMHGGRIGVYSPGEGRGTTFVMDLPCDVEALPDATLPPHPPLEAPLALRMPPAPAAASATAAATSCDAHVLQSPGHVAIARLGRLSRSNSLTLGSAAHGHHRRDNSIVLETLFAAPSPTAASPSAGPAAAAAVGTAADAAVAPVPLPPSTAVATTADRSSIGHRLRYNSVSPHQSLAQSSPAAATTGVAVAKSAPLPSPFPSAVTTPAADAASADSSVASSTKTAAHDAATRSLPPLAPPTSTHDARVLVVDDAPSNRKMVKRVLGLHYGTVDDAENGAQAVACIDLARRAGRPYHMVLMDFMMPVMNGLEATTLIKQQQPDVLVLGVTGNGLEHDMQAFRAAGADDVLLKPLNLTHCNEAFARFYRLALPER